MMSEFSSYNDVDVALIVQKLQYLNQDLKTKSIKELVNQRALQNWKAYFFLVILLTSITFSSRFILELDLHEVALLLVLKLREYKAYLKICRIL